MSKKDEQTSEVKTRKARIVDTVVFIALSLGAA